MPSLIQQLRFKKTSLPNICAGPYELRYLDGLWSSLDADQHAVRLGPALPYRGTELTVWENSGAISTEHSLSELMVIRTNANRVASYFLNLTMHT